jgi:hypothetical protein
MVKSRYGDAIESEAEFQKIYALQKAFDERFPREALTGRISADVLRARAEAERQLETDIRAAVGDERYAALQRSADPDLRAIDALATRLNLPPTATDQVLASRSNYSAESQRISGDTSLPLPQRRAAIQALATQARSDLARTLGGEAAEAYAQRSPWMSMLQNGMAFSTIPQEGAPGSLFPGPAQSVYPVIPAGMGAGGGQRQFVINAAPPLDGPPNEDVFVGGRNVQVMSFSATTSEATAPAAGTVARNPAVPVSGTIVSPPAAPTPGSAAPRP